MSREAATASRLLAKYGEPVVVAFPGAPAFDPVTGAPTTGAAGTTYTAKGYPGRYESGEIDDTVIRADDVRLILELIAQRPATGCTALVDGVTYRVMVVKPIRKAGQDVVYICQLRRN